ncbi:hypothetical protein [Agriterribacter sp.]|uniref:hypothetical protein n=1 Tax=Agriterribacter sp. TaxID=2821509 RepID=UPI002CD9EC1A|nr:hypothetical protein [Agriterribacter sp.]HRP58231.1 hypothetical protein [Agriterribacter sp.]
MGTVKSEPPIRHFLRRRDRLWVVGPDLVAGTRHRYHRWLPAGRMKEWRDVEHWYNSALSFLLPVIGTNEASAAGCNEAMNNYSETDA